MKQSIYAVGEHIGTAEYTCWTDMSHLEVRGRRKEIPNKEIVQSFQSPTYFKTESEALQYALNNAKFEIKQDPSKEKIMTQCSAVFKVELNDIPTNDTKYVVNRLMESQVPEFQKINLNLELLKYEKKGIWNLFKQQKIFYCNQSNFHGDLKSLDICSEDLPIKSKL